MRTILRTLCGAVVPVCLMLLVGCSKSSRREQAETERPVAGPPPGPRRIPCAPAPGRASLSVGARPRPSEAEEVEDDEPVSRGAVEFARAAADGATFLLGLSSHAEESRALVAVLDPLGAQILELGPVASDAEPPRVAARNGHYLVVLTGAASAPSTLRVMGISRQEEGLALRLGPEVLRGAPDAGSADVAVLASGQAFVVWQRTTAGERSEIVGFSLDARSLREKSEPRSLTPSSRAARDARLLAGADGYWLLWLEEEAGATPGAADDSALGVLVQPPSVLFARELDADGRVRSAPIPLTAPVVALVFDARMLPSGRLLVAHRSAPEDRPADEQPTHLSLVDAGGAVRRSSADAPELLGLGVPTLIGQEGKDVSWLPIEVAAGTTAFGRVALDGAVSSALLTGLGGRVALAGEPRLLLTAEPRGVGLDLSVEACALD